MRLIANSFAWLDNIYGSSLRLQTDDRDPLPGVLIDVYGIETWVTHQRVHVHDLVELVL
jgi:hypothetical protein